MGATFVCEGVCVWVRVRVRVCVCVFVVHYNPGTGSTHANAPMPLHSAALSYHTHFNLRRNRPTWTGRGWIAAGRLCGRPNPWQSEPETTWVCLLRADFPFLTTRCLWSDRWWARAQSANSGTEMRPFDAFKTCCAHVRGQREGWGVGGTFLGVCWLSTPSGAGPGGEVEFLSCQRPR